MFVFQLGHKLVDVRAVLDLVFGEYVDVVNPAVARRVGEGYGYQTRVGFDGYRWIGLFFYLVDPHGQVTVAADGDRTVGSGGDGLDVPGGIHFGIVGILHLGHFKRDARKRNRIGWNNIGLLTGSFGGGLCNVLHPVFMDGQAPRCTGIR